MTSTLATSVSSVRDLAAAEISAQSLADVLHADVQRASNVILPHDRRQAQVQTYVRTETIWTQELPAEFAAVPNKTPFDLHGSPCYPELLVVRLFEESGWGAAWLKSWNGQAYWRDIREPIELPQAVASVVRQVCANAGQAGEWDILAWRNRQLRLLISRRPGGQPVGAYHAAWLNVALRMGLPISWFAVVEHHVASQPRRRRLGSGARS